MPAPRDRCSTFAKARGLRRFLACLALVCAASSGAGAGPEIPSSSIAGTWEGSLRAGGTTLPLVFILGEPPGYPGSSLDSPKQGARGIPIAAVRVQGSSVTIVVSSIRGEYSGRIAEGGESIEGVWKQGGVGFPLVLTRGAPVAAAPHRPQTPVPPYPYRVEEVSIRTKDPAVTLAGSLVLPPGEGPFPALLLFTGSGAQNRDEEIAGHRPFLVLADALARRGIASLRCDDRGVGGSTGDASPATTLDFADDAEAAARFLLSRQEVDRVRCGILGHSEGGIVAAAAATRIPGISFLVLLAAPGIPGARLLEEQNRMLARASGADESSIEESSALNRRLYAAAMSGLPGPELERTLRRLFMEGIAEMESLGPAGEAQAMQAASRTAAQLSTPWFRSFLALDPAPLYRAAGVPVLALNGSLDLQVAADENLAAIGNALTPRLREVSTLLRLDGLNHLFQRAETGLPEEYGEIVLTMDVLVPGIIADWIAAVPLPVSIRR